MFDTAALHVSAQDSDARPLLPNWPPPLRVPDYTPRAVSALNGAHVTTVGELPRPDSTLSTGW